MGYLQIPYISGQYSGLGNELLLTPDKHKVIYNGSFNDFGKWTARDGCTKVSDVGSGNLLSMHDAAFQDGTHIHIGHNTTKVYNLQSGAQLGSATWTTGLDTEYANFLNLVFVVNGTDAMSTINSSGTKVTTTNVTSAPVSNYIIRHGSRIWTNDTTNLRRVHRSSVPASGAITWDTTLEFFDVDSAGDYVTGLHSARNTVMAFTNIDVEIRYFTRARLGVLTGVGTLSNRSIITKQGTTYWTHPDKDKGFAGVYGYSGTGADEAKLMSSPVQDVFDAMTDTQWDNHVAWGEGSSLVWYLGGDISMDYGTVNAVSLNLKNKGWSVHYYPYTILCASNFLNSTTLTTQAYIGDDAATTYSRTGTRDEKQAGSVYFDIEAFWESYPIYDREDPFQYNHFESIAVKGDAIANTKIISQGSQDTEPYESNLEKSYHAEDIWDAPLDANGSAVTVKQTMNGRTGQSIKGYRIKYKPAGETN